MKHIAYSHASRRGARRMLIVVGATLAFCAGLVATAQISGPNAPGAGQSVPELIPYRGYVAVDGAPITQAVALRFTMRRGSSTGTQVWQETQANVQVIRGAFGVSLGMGTPFVSVTPSLGGVPLFQIPDLFLGVEIDLQNGGAGSTFLPVGEVQRVTGLAYSMTARQARRFDIALDANIGTAALRRPITSPGRLVVSGTSTFANLSTGALTVSGNLHTKTSSASTGHAVVNSTFSAGHYASAAGAPTPLGITTPGTSASGGSSTDFIDYPTTGRSLCVLAENNRGIYQNVANRNVGCTITNASVTCGAATCRRWTLTAVASSANDWINCSMNCLYIP